MDDELLRLKQSDLRQYMAFVGFVIDRRESSRGSTVMRREHEKLIISRKPDGVYTWWDVHSEYRGTIIDFVQREEPGLNLGAVRKELRAWMGLPGPALPEMPALVPTSPDLADVRRRYFGMSVPSNHSYLEDERAIPAATLLHCSKAHVCNALAGRVRGCPPIPAVTLGRRKLVRRESLMRWIDQNEAGSLPQMGS